MNLLLAKQFHTVSKRYFNVNKEASIDLANIFVLTTDIEFIASNNHPVCFFI